MSEKNKLLSLLTMLLGVQIGSPKLNSQFKKAERLIGQGKIDEAMALYKEIADKYAQSDPALTKKGRDGTATCMFIRAKESLANKNYTDAKSKIEQIMASFADSIAAREGQTVLVAAQVEISKKLAAENKHAACLEQSKAVQAKVSPGTEGLDRLKAVIGTCLFMRADALVKDKRFSEAVPLLESVVKDYPQTEKISDARNALSAALTAGSMTALDQNKVDAAADLYERILADFSENTESVAAAHYGLSGILLKKGDRQNALSHAKEAAQRAPGNSEYLFHYAGLLFETGDIEAAKTAYGTLIEPLHAEIRNTYINKEKLQFKLGQAYLRLGNYTEAAVEFDKALNRDPSMTEARVGLANAQFNDKNYAGAALSYNQLISQLSADFEDMKSKSAKEKDPIEAAKRLEDLRRQIAFFHYQSGSIFEQMGDYPKAMEEYRLGFEGVSTQEAAATLKRLQAAMQQHGQGEAK